MRKKRIKWSPNLHRKKSWVRKPQAIHRLTLRNPATVCLAKVGFGVEERVGRG